jgi:hypothetical protein
MFEAREFLRKKLIGQVRRHGFEPRGRVARWLIIGIYTICIYEPV